MRGINRTGALFNLEKTMVSVLHKGLQSEVEKLLTRSFRFSSEDQNHLNFQLVNKPSRISLHEVLQS